MKHFFQNLSEKAAKRVTIGLVLAGLLLLIGALYITFSSDPGYEVTTYSMGSYVQQTVYGRNREKAAQEAADAVAALEDLISWRVEGSDIARLNDAAGTEFISLHEDTLNLLRLSLTVSEASGGAFDVTIAPVSRLWDFDDTPHLPDDSLIQKMLPQVGYETLSVLEDGTAALRKSGTALDLGAIGKGAACDAVISAYEQAGAERAVIAVGGSVGTFGKKLFGEPWHIAVRDPRGDGSLGRLSIEAGFVSTSGSYEKQFTEDGKSYHHLLDPKTGYPAESGLISVTVWSEQGALSDALSTACFVLGMEESQPLLEQFGAEALFITEQDEIYVTAGLSQKFTLTSKDYSLAGEPGSAAN